MDLDKKIITVPASSAVVFLILFFLYKIFKHFAD